MRTINMTPDTLMQIPNPGCPSCNYWHGEMSGDIVAAKSQMICDRKLQGKIALSDKGSAMGYIQYGPIASFPVFSKLRQEFGVEGLSDAWVITCIVTHKSYRGNGVAKTLLKAVLDEAQEHGYTVEAIGMEEADLEKISTGPTRLYKETGFEELGRFRDKYGMNVLLQARPARMLKGC